MGARSYRIGRDDEWHVQRMAELAGCLVVRAAGSHGTDLLVFTPNGANYACDLKRNDWAGPASRKLMADWLDHNVWPVLVCIDTRARVRRVWWRRVHYDTSMSTPTDVPPWEWGE